MHGEFREQRGAWRLYASASGDALLLEHDGEELQISVRDVGTLRGRIDFGLVEMPVHGFGYGLCDITIEPRRGVCLAAMVLPGTDPFLVADRLDRLLGEHGARACYGVVVQFGEIAVAW